MIASFSYLPGYQMSIRNTRIRYGSVAKTLHWLIALLVITILCIGYLMQYIKNEKVFGEVINIHKLMGLSILILMIMRAVWALINPKPELPPSSATWVAFASRSVHILFYILLIAMPIAGWIMSIASGYVPKFFSWSIMLPIPRSKYIADLFENIHNTLAIVIIVVIVLHVSAALYHYFFKKDNVLQRMLPGSN